MACVLQIGAGGVGGVVAHKMAKNRDVFTRIILASRTLDKCKKIADSIREKGLGEIEIDKVDADNIDDLVALIQKYKPKLVVNVALPYQDLSIMHACLQTSTHYLDTANYEHPDSAHFEYKEQWAYDARYKQAGLFALLGSGFDPGVTNVFCAYAQKHYFDSIESIDILDCNAGDHGYAFATNFNPEINLREVSSKARFWTCEKANLNDTSLESNLALNPDLQEDCIYRKFERVEKHWTQEVRDKINKQSSLDEKSGLRRFERGDKTLESIAQASGELPDLSLKNEAYCGGEWRDVAPLALMKEWDYTEVGVKNSYLLYHEELESIVRNIKGLRKIRFFMTFGESYLTHMKVLENVGLLRIDEVAHKGAKIIPIEVLKTLLPDPASLASRTKGKTHIGCFIRGYKDSKLRTIYIYNICDHEACYKEVNAQGVSYTTGVPAMIGAKLIVEGKWGVGCVKNTSLLDSKDSNAVSAFNAARAALNKDMPHGGEAQGIDKVVLSAAASLGDFAGCQGGGEGSLLDINDRAATADSRKSGKEATQGAGVWNMEQNDPDPFMAELNKQGLPYVVLDVFSPGNYKVLEDGRKRL